MLYNPEWTPYVCYWPEIWARPAYPSSRWVLSLWRQYPHGVEEETRRNYISWAGSRTIFWSRVSKTKARKVLSNETNAQAIPFISDFYDYQGPGNPRLHFRCLRPIPDESWPLLIYGFLPITSRACTTPGLSYLMVLTLFCASDYCVCSIRLYLLRMSCSYSCIQCLFNFKWFIDLFIEDILITSKKNHANHVCTRKIV